MKVLGTERSYRRKRTAFRPPFLSALARKLIPHSQLLFLSTRLLPSIEMVKDAHLTKRPSVKLKISCGSSDISNSEVVSASGQSLYAISSNSKSTTLVSCKNNIEVATVNWDRSSPRMVFRRKKMKCKEWLPLAGPDTEYVTGLRYCPMSF